MCGSANGILFGPGSSVRSTFYSLCLKKKIYELFKFISPFNKVAVGKVKEMSTTPSVRPEGDYNSIRVCGRESFSNDDCQVGYLFIPGRSQNFKGSNLFLLNFT